MSEVLLIGSRGTLGAYLAETLISKYTVRTFDRKFSKEVSHTSELGNLLVQHSITSIINCVGATDVKRCEIDKEYAYNGNTVVPEVITRISKHVVKPCHVINFSTDQVYPGTGNASEEDISPVNEYGRSKLVGEQMLSSNACNLRINYVSKGRNRSSFSDWIVNTAKRMDQVSLYNDVYFNPVDLRTLGNCVEHILENTITGTFNIGAHSKLSKAEFYTNLTQMLGISNPNTILKNYSELSATPRPLDMSMSIEKACEYGFILPSMSNVFENLAKEYRDAN